MLHACEQNEEIDPSQALVMIPRVLIKPPEEPTLSKAPEDTEEVDSPQDIMPLDMSAAIPPKKSTKRAQVKNRDWRSSIQAYNEL